MAKIDLLKIDIEGAERYLFETNTLADQILDNTRVLVIEIHDEFDVRKTIEEHLTRHGFTYFNHGDITIATRIKKFKSTQHGYFSNSVKSLQLLL